MSSHPRIPLRAFFAGVTEHAFQTRLGIADPPLVDYLVGLLTRFVRYDALYSVRSLTGRRVSELVEMLAEAESRIGAAKRDVHRHIGDFTLFWTGVYPEALDRLQSNRRLDHFVDYCSQGKRAYHIASTIPTDKQEDVGSDVLERLSHDFEMCAYGLNEVRREWERREPGSSQGLFVVDS